MTTVEKARALYVIMEKRASEQSKEYVRSMLWASMNKTAGAYGRPLTNVFSTLPLGGLVNARSAIAPRSSAPAVPSTPPAAPAGQYPAGNPAVVQPMRQPATAQERVSSAYMYERANKRKQQEDAMLQERNRAARYGFLGNMADKAMGPYRTVFKNINNGIDAYKNTWNEAQQQ